MLSCLQVPLSVPSQPASPESKQHTTGLDTGFAAMTIAATTAMPIATTQAELTFQHPASNLGAGLLQQTANSATMTPAPVTIVRSSPIPPDPSKLSQQLEMPSSTTALGSSVTMHMRPHSGDSPYITSGLPPASMSSSVTTHTPLTNSGLPTAPPPSFPISMMPPTISLGPTPSLQSSTSHTPSSSAQQ